MSVSYASNRVTVDGGFAGGAATITASQTLVRTSGDVPASSWVGRLIAFIPSTTTSVDTQVRLVTAVSGNNVTVHDPWLDKGDLVGDFRVAHNLDDIHAIGNAALQKVGTKTYRWDADWNITNRGFLGDLDVSLEMTLRSGTNCPVSSGCIVQFGLLWGGEANNSFETTNGCSILFNRVAGSISNCYALDNSRDANGGVINYYNSIIQSIDPSDSNWHFQRMRGPMRFIGCQFDGPMGGRFYHEGTEWVQCRMSGNVNAIPAWSIGATFTRPVDSVLFYQNNTMFKNYQSFEGVLRNVTIADSNQTIFNDSGSGVIDFVDCTTVSVSSADIEQFKSVNYIITDAGGVPIPGAKVRINNASDVTQTGIQTSDSSGVVPEILTLFRKGNTSYTPFRIRVREYGKLWTDLNSPIADPIRQSVAMPDNPNVTLDETTASAPSGTGAVQIFDYEGFTPLTFGGEVFSLEIAINPNIVGYPDTAEKVKHFLHWFGAQDAGMVFHEFAPMSGFETQRATYGSYGNKGVIITLDVNGDGSVLEPFPGFTRFQADNGNFYIPPVTYQLQFTGLVPNSEVRAYTGTDPATSVEIGGIENSGTSFAFSHTSGGVDGYVVIAALGYQNLYIPITYASENQTIPVQQILDRQYNNPA